MRCLWTLLTLTACAGPAPAPADDLAWLVGSWRNADLHTETVESWRIGPNRELMGQSAVKLITDVGTAVGYAETLLITEAPGGRTYVAWPVGQEPTTYRVVTAAPDQLTVENPGQAFPQRLAYVRVQDILDVTATGTKNGQPHEESFKLTRMVTP